MPQEPRSESHQVQPHRGGELLLPCVRADEFAHSQNPRRRAVQNVQRAAAKQPGVLFCRLCGLLKYVFLTRPSRYQYANFEIRLDQSASSRHLSGESVLKENLQLQRIHKLQFMKRRIANRLALDQRDDFRAVRFGVVEFDKAARVQVGHGSPPRASRTSSLSGLPGGCSPQMALARARKSGRGADVAGTTLAMTLSCCVTCTSSPAATQRRISGHCCGNC